MNAIKEIPIRSLLDLPESALKKQYTEFLRKLEKLTVKYKPEELESLDPKELIKKFFDPGGKLLKIEMVMQAIAADAIMRVRLGVNGVKIRSPLQQSQKYGRRYSKQCILCRCEWP
jgi:hypothetical protein